MRRGLLGDLGGQSCHRSDQLALVADGVLREQIAILDERAVLDIGNILVGDHREHSGQRASRRGVDRDDSCPRVVGKAELGVQHAREGHVGGVPAGAGDLLLAVLADVPCTDDRRHMFLLLERESQECNLSRSARVCV